LVFGEQPFPGPRQPPDLTALNLFSVLCFECKNGSRRSLAAGTNRHRSQTLPHRRGNEALCRNLRPITADHHAFHRRALAVGASATRGAIVG